LSSFGAVIRPLYSVDKIREEKIGGFHKRHDSHAAPGPFEREMSESPEFKTRHPGVWRLATS
jgi:hypothetical protein